MKTRRIIPVLCTAALIAVPATTATSATKAAKASARVVNGPCNRAEVGLKTTLKTGQRIECQRVGSASRWRVIAAEGAATAATNVTVEKSVYVSGTRVEIKTASLIAGAFVAEGRIHNENLGDGVIADILFRTPVLLELADTRVELQWPDLSRIPVGSSSPLRFSARLQTTAGPLSAARLVFANTTENQSVLPIGPGPVTTFVPKSGFGIGSTISLPHFKAEVLETKLRSTYRSQLKNQYWLDVRIKGTSLLTEAEGRGGFNVTDNSFTLVQPNGNAAAGAAQGMLDAESLNLGLYAGQSGMGWVRFTIEQTSGKFVLRVNTNNLTGETSFDVP